jgi:adenosylcobyric acid synthase
VLRLPHISNYTDFDPLEHEPDVALTYLDHRDALGEMHLLILPGTKNTVDDLRYLKATGLSGQIQAYVRNGGRLLGICGGYQILGQEVRDPLGMEGPPRTEEGLALLPVVTTMAGEKTTTQVKARALHASGAGGDESMEAYEIHMGETEARGPGGPAFAIVERYGHQVAVEDGWVSPDGRVLGTYLHGLFENDVFRRRFLKTLGPGESTPDAEGLSFRAFLETQLDRLAEEIRRCLDISLIKDLIRL